MITPIVLLTVALALAVAAGLWGRHEEEQV